MASQRPASHPSEQYLTTLQVAARLQVAPGTVRRMARDGLLQECRLGHRTIRYRAEDVDAAMAPGGTEAETESDDVDAVVRRVTERIRRGDPPSRRD